MLAPRAEELVAQLQAKVAAQRLLAAQEQLPAEDAAKKNANSCGEAEERAAGEERAKRLRRQGERGNEQRQLLAALVDAAQLFVRAEFGETHSCPRRRR